MERLAIDVVVWRLIFVAQLNGSHRISMLLQMNISLGCTTYLKQVLDALCVWPATFQSLQGILVPQALPCPGDISLDAFRTTLASPSRKCHSCVGSLYVSQPMPP